MLTIGQGIECQIVSRTIQEDETIEHVVSMENIIFSDLSRTRAPFELRPC